ncbi:hypothetical protein [Janthinobacterium sp. AD80]|uniref:hypothetical protein n=1 Tax=Janthinobacterium sp. AD80 TaxID=1528773 RepID=UPI0015E11DEC|nr:hypothetical protein [Janthinobacterium sp. AD80]
MKYAAPGQFSRRKYGQQGLIPWLALSHKRARSGIVLRLGKAQARLPGKAGSALHSSNYRDIHAFYSLFSGRDGQRSRIG